MHLTLFGNEVRKSTKPGSPIAYYSSLIVDPLIAISHSWTLVLLEDGDRYPSQDE